MILGCIIFSVFLKAKEAKNVVIAGSLILFFLSFSDIILVTHTNRTFGIGDFIFVLLGDGLQTILIYSNIALPLFAMAAKLSPDGIESTYFAFFFSALNLSLVMSSILGGILSQVFDVNKGDYHNIFYLMLLKSLGRILTFLCSLIIPSLKEDNAILIKEDESSEI